MMNRNDLVDVIKKNYLRSNGRLHTNGIPDNIKNEILNYTIGIDSTASYSERWIWLQNNYFDYPKCEECGNPVKKLDASSTKYRRFCSKKCSALNSDVRKKKEERWILNYGASNPNKSNQVRNKIKDTCLKKYGVKTNLQTLDVNKLRKLAFDQKSDQIFSKMKKTCIAKYGVDHPVKSIEVQNKIKKTMNEKFGADFFKLAHIKYQDVLDSKELFEEAFNDKTFKELLDYFNVSESYLHKTIKKYDLHKKYRSYLEKSIAMILDDFKTQYEQNTRQIIPPKELDFYLSSHNLAIEVCGLYWHSEAMGKDNNYHLNKLLECTSKDIKLITIFEDEIIDKFEIVRSRLSNLLNLNNEKIYARKCEVKEISSSITKQFNIDNHIQGHVISKINLGLYYNNTLVAVMTFGKKRKSLGSNSIENSFELLRFATLKYTTVVGGASKLLKHFISKYNPKEIISYADKRWSDGNLYQTLGFKYSHSSKPNYWYTKDFTNREYRFKYRKDQLVKNYPHMAHMTESKIMNTLGYTKIWDCGNLVYVWRNNDQKLI